MKLGEVVVIHVYYNFTKFHQNRMKNKKSFINSPFFCSEFQSVSRIVKIIHSGAAGGLRVLPLSHFLDARSLPSCYSGEYQKLCVLYRLPYHRISAKGSARV